MTLLLARVIVTSTARCLCWVILAAILTPAMVALGVLAIPYMMYEGMR